MVIKEQEETEIHPLVLAKRATSYLVPVLLGDKVLHSWCIVAPCEGTWASKGPAVAERTFCTTREPLHQKDIWETPKKIRCIPGVFGKEQRSLGVVESVVGRQTQSLALCSDCSKNPRICYAQKSYCVKVLERRQPRNAHLPLHSFLETNNFSIDLYLQNKTCGERFKSKDVIGGTRFQLQAIQFSTSPIKEFDELLLIWSANFETLNAY